MKVFNSLEEMNPYYNEETNTYEFIENNRLIDIKIDFDLNMECNIKSRNIKALDIKARDIQALYIKSCDIKSRNIKALDIKACNINSGNIKACDIEAWDIEAFDIKARDIQAFDINAGDINAWDINSGDINARNIKANNISFYAVCFARETFVCNSIKGRRENSKYFCLDSEVVIKSQKS